MSERAGRGAGGGNCGVRAPRGDSGCGWRLPNGDLAIGYSFANQVSQLGIYDGTTVTSTAVPVLSIRSLLAMPNGDLIVGGIR